MDTDELSKSGRVIVPSSLGIAIGLKNWVGGHNLVLKGDLLLRLLARASGNHGKIGDDLLGVLGLASTRLSGDQHGIVLLVLQHVAIGSLRNSPQMGRDLIPPLAQVELYGRRGVDRVTLVRVHSHTEQTRVGLDMWRND